MTDREDSEFVRHLPCGNCGSSDANGLYTDGHTHCFSCGAHTEASDGASLTPSPKRRQSVAGLLEGEVRGIRTRKITDETAKHFGYKVGLYKKKPVQIADYYDKSGNLVAQHLRTADKQFPWLGEPTDAMPFGYHAFPKSGRRLVVTEGEMDALSVSQAQGNKWPVWSIACGAGPQIKKYIAKHLDLFREFEEVVLCFDSDKPGRQAATAAAQVLGARARIAELPLKDASEMLVAGKGEDLINALWRALPYRPDGIVSLASLKERVFQGTEMGMPWPYESWTAMTYGRRLGEIYAFGAGTGVGKTDLFLEVVKQTAFDLGQKCGLFFLEQQPSETAMRMAGKLVGKMFHVPDAGWTKEDLEAAWKQVEGTDKVFLYDAFGSHSYESIEERIRYLVHAEDVRHHFIDHITALTSEEGEERKAIDSLMARLGGLVKELNIAIYIVSHLATPEGAPHEEGGRVMIRHFRGSRAIGFWSHFMFGLERHQQHEDPTIRRTTTVRCLKDRYTGKGTGLTFYLRQDPETGRTEEVDFLSDDPATAKNPFEDESGKGDTDDF